MPSRKKQNKTKNLFFLSFFSKKESSNTYWDILIIFIPSLTKTHQLDSKLSFTSLKSEMHARLWLYHQMCDWMCWTLGWRTQKSCQLIATWWMRRLLAATPVCLVFRCGKVLIFNFSPNSWNLNLLTCHSQVSVFMQLMWAFKASVTSRVFCPLT